jgi:hypothetical protein
MSLEESRAAYLSIPGGPDLLDWFGGVPSFHDAEVLGLTLDRAGPSRLTIHGWVMTERVDEKGYFILDRHAVVTYVLNDISDLRLDGFTRQNVIDGLRLRRTQLPSGTTDLGAIHRSEEVFELTLADCYGLSGTIWAQDVRVEIRPGKP